MIFLFLGRFAFAGTKDRRAVTSQWISVDLPAKQIKGSLTKHLKRGKRGRGGVRMFKGSDLRKVKEYIS